MKISFARTALLIRLLFILNFFSLVERAHAYPFFISYGYNNCVACHYNGQGGGALNDYGKALMASEFSSKIFYPESTTDEELGERSGFPGSKRLPSWFRPGLKYRGLWFQTNPGSNKAISKYVTMQADFNAAIVFDEDQKYVAVATIGYNANSLGGGGGEKLSSTIMRERYFRWHYKENLMLYVGLMDKAYGLRIVDHTAVSRKDVGIAQNDQTDGVMLVYNAAPWEYTTHAFVGNLSQDSTVQHKGISFMAEKDVRNMLRIGGSVLASKNDYVTWTRTAFHSKYGFSKGNSLLSEVGLIRNAPAAGAANTGLYALLESMSLVSRGVHFLSQFEYYNETMSTKSPDKTRWSLGFLMFPAPRFEFRTSVVNGRSISDTGVSDDQWSVQLQLHLSI